MLLRGNRLHEEIRFSTIVLTHLLINNNHIIILTTIFACYNCNSKFNNTIILTNLAEVTQYGYRCRSISIKYEYDIQSESNSSEVSGAFDY